MAPSLPTFWFTAALLAMICGCGTRKPEVKLPIDDARALLFKKKYAEAQKVCDTLLEADSRNVDALLLRGEIYEKQNELEAAEKDYTRAIKVQPQHPKPYQRRYKLYMELVKRAQAEKTVDDAEVNRLYDLAVADHDKVKELDDDAKTAYENDINPRNPLLDRPIPSYTQPEEEALAEAKKSIYDDPEDKDKDENDLTKKQDEAKEDAEPEFADKAEENKEPDVINESARDFLVRNTLPNEKPQEIILPPHLDPEAANDEVPPPSITQFRLPQDQQGNLLLPDRSNQPKTGLSASPNEPDPNFDGPVVTPRLNRFYLQNQIGQALATPGVRTGIGNARSSVGVVAPGQNFQAGFLPPEARGMIGPRIVPLRNQDDAMEEPTAPVLPGQTPDPNTPILTTALPGTTFLYGTGGGISAESAGAGGAATGTQRGGTSPYGKITDRNYSPLRSRPKTTSTLPTLPPVN